MPRFGKAEVMDVIPRRRQPSQRSQIQGIYTTALADAIQNDQALEMELDEGDNTLTVRYRIKRAADTLGFSSRPTSDGAPFVKIRRKGNRMYAFLAKDYNPSEELRYLNRGRHKKEVPVNPPAKARAKRSKRETVKS